MLVLAADKSKVHKMGPVTDGILFNVLSADAREYQLVHARPSLLNAMLRRSRVFCSFFLFFQQLGCPPDKHE